MSAINIGNHIDKKSYEGVVDGIIKIFEASEKHHIDEMTTRKALEILTGAAGVSGVSISNSQFQGEWPDNKTKPADPDPEYEEEDDDEELEPEEGDE